LTLEERDISLTHLDTMEKPMNDHSDEHLEVPPFRHEDRGPFPFLFAGRGRGGGRGPFGPGGPPPGGPGGFGPRGGGPGPFGPGGFGPGGFGPPGGFGWGPFRRGPRARRGDIRSAILALLQEEPRNGYQIIQELKQRSQGLWNPSPGSVYPALQLLEDERLIATEEGPSGRVYTLTSQGKAYVKKHADEIAAPWEAFSSAAGDDFAEVMGLFRQLGAAVMQVVQAGDAAQVAKAKKLLVATRRSLYEILAAGAPEDE
jgi:DNA-binding PadR family transcriptional regulator